MAKAKRGLLAPSLDAFRLERLTESTADDLVARADLEGVHLARIDVEDLDLEAATVALSHFDGLRADVANLSNCRLNEVVISQADVPVLRSARSGWRDVRIEDSRIGSAELYESTWDSVEFVNCKLGFLNLRGTQLRDVRFVNCTIEELDLGGAQVDRLAFSDVALRSLDIQQVRAKNFDLRGAELDQISGTSYLKGATISSLQLTLLAPLLAAEFGIDVQD